jgi:hypothetical protein
MAVAVVASAFVAILALGTGPAAPVVTAIATLPAIHFAERVAAEWRRKSNTVAASALRASGFADPEAFCEALTSDPDMIALTQKILFAAAVTGNEGKLRALGEVLGRAAGGQPLDETNLLIDALADIEEPHVTVMEVIDRPAPEGRPGWLPSHVQAEVDLQPDLVLAVLETLNRRGLTDADRNIYGAAPQYMLTSLGSLLLSVMRQAASGPTAGAA